MGFQFQNKEFVWLFPAIVVLIIFFLGLLAAYCCKMQDAIDSLA
jgi:hypothetical protein